MSRPIAKSSAAVIKAVDVVRCSGAAGITIRDIADHCGWRLAHTKNVMTAAAAFELAVPVQTQYRVALWFVPELADAFRTASNAASKARKHRRNREAFRPARPSAPAPDPACIYRQRELSDEPTRCVVLAASAPPVVMTGVRSIFDLVSA